MFKYFNCLLLFLLLGVPTITLISHNGLALAQENGQPAAEEDAMEDELMEDEAEATVEEGTDSADSTEDAVQETDKSDEDEDESLKPSPDADATLLFVKPTTSDLPAGSVVHLLAGFANNGEQNFILNSIDAGLVHPQDFRYYMLNFTRTHYYMAVEPGRHASLDYVFPVREDLVDRPFGLVITLNYTNAAGDEFMNVLYNDTITIRDPEEGFDGETFFMYLTLAALALLVLFGAHHGLNSLRRKHGGAKQRPVEMGTQRAGVDYDWIPKDTMKHLDGSPGRSPKTSPRLRRSKRLATGSGSE